MPIYRSDMLWRYAQRVFAAAGSDGDVASRVATALVDANLAGHDSHGVIRIPQYVDSVRAGEILPDARPMVVKETAVSALVDGGWGYGQVTAERATMEAVKRARVQGLSAVAAVRCNHIGRLGEYSEMAAREGMIACVIAGGFGGEAAAAPFGGKTGLFGTNPLSFGFPAYGETAMLVDFATTAVAAGKIRVARAKGASLPPGSILDRDGQHTTNPEDFYHGGVMLPFGGHKGYALSMVVELLGRVLTGADSYAEGGRGGAVYGQSGTFVLAIDPTLFRDRGSYEQAVTETCDRVRAVPPAPGFDEVLVPGDPEARSRIQRQRDGIEVEQATIDAILATALSLGVTSDLVPVQ